MKNFIALLLGIAAVFGTALPASAATPADGDRIIGLYKAVKDGEVSHVRISKTGDNSYRAQVVWVENKYDKNGAVRTDVKNPDPAKRSVPADEIVLIDKVSYSDGMWKDGQVSDPTKGKVYRVEITFKDEKTLRVRGFLGPFSLSVYWDKLE